MRGKQAVIKPEDIADEHHRIQPPQPVELCTVRVEGLKGQYMRVFFGDDHIAHNVDANHLEALIAQFGEKSVKILD